jgi:hypothetical protein
MASRNVTGWVKNRHPTDSSVISHGAFGHLRRRQDRSGPLPVPSRSPPGGSRIGIDQKVRNHLNGQVKAYGWMSNLGRAGGTRTHDPRIMSLDFNILSHSRRCCFVPVRPGSIDPRIRYAPPGSVAPHACPSRVPPTSVVALTPPSLPPRGCVGGIATRVAP